MALPTYEYITIDRILAEVKIDLDIQGSLSDIRLVRWIIEAVDEMSTLWDYVENEAFLDINPHTGIAILPCDFVRFDRPNPIILTHAGLPDTSTYADNYGLTYTGGAFLKSQRCSATVQVQDGKLYFSTGISEGQCKISYLAVNVDEDGSVKVPIMNKRPVIAYCGYKWLRASNGRGDLMLDYKAEWTQGKLDRRGKAAVLDSLQKQQMSRIMNATLRNFGNNNPY